MCIEDTSYDLDCSISSTRSSILSPHASPRERKPDDDAGNANYKEERVKSRNALKLRLVNDLGQIRLTSKMRDKEKFLRK